MFELKLNEQDVAVIGEALGNLPYRVAAPVVARMNAQITAQTRKAAEERAEQERKAA